MNLEIFLYVFEKLSYWASHGPVHAICTDWHGTCLARLVGTLVLKCIEQYRDKHLTGSTV